MTAPLAPELQQELDGPLNWMYEWEIDGRKVELLNPELESIHPTRLELIEEPVRAALSAAGPDATAVDLACSEGWFAHRLLEWGASRVDGFDIRDLNVRRARLLRDYAGIAPERFSVEQRDLYTLDVDAMGQYDVVLLLGLIYHVEDPVGALRRARRLTRGVAAVDTQLTRQVDPIPHTWGVADVVEQSPASLAVRLEADSATNPVASDPGMLSFVPNRPAVELMLEAAGFSRWEWRDPAPHHSAQYRSGDRGVIVALP